MPAPRPKAFRGQRYQRLKRGCLHAGTLFEDPEFPAASTSLFWHRDSPEGLSWKRPGHRSCARIPGFLWTASAPMTFTRAVWATAGLWPLPRAWPANPPPGGRSRSGTPDGPGDTVVSSASASGAGGPGRRLNGCYEALEGGNTAEALVDFTGGISEPLALDEGGFGADPAKREELFKQLKKAYARAALLSCSIRPLPDVAPEAQLSCGLIRGHAYGITAVQTVSFHRCLHLLEFFKTKKLRLIRMRNSWGTVEWNGAWSDKSTEWQQVSHRDRQRMGVTVQDDGEFWMCFEDFCTHFTDVIICLRMNTARLSCRQSWVEGLQFGEWDPHKGHAGGCLNYQDTFLSNPQFFFEVPRAQDMVLISLQQKDRRELCRGAEPGGRNLPVGFELFRVEQNRR